MKAFRFRLQTKLNIAGRQEEIAKEELQLRIMERNEVQQELEANVGRLKRMEQSIREYMEANVPWPSILLIKEYLPILKALIITLKKELYLAEEKVEQARNLVIERIKETRTLERLKEKEWLLYLQEWNREEQKIVDEIAITGHYRKNFS